MSDEPVDPVVSERPWVPALRAAFVAFHVVIVVLLSVPEPEVREDDLARPEVKKWFDEATTRVQAWGLEVSREEVEAWSITWGRRYLAVRDVVLYPAWSYANFTGAQQSWRMFGDVPANTAVFFIEARHGKEWTLIHQSRFGEATWRASFFDQERLRAMINQFTRKKGRGAWDRLAKWLGKELPADFPEAEAFRMGMLSVELPDPQTLAETGDLRWGNRFWLTSIPVSP